MFSLHSISLNLQILSSGRILRLLDLLERPPSRLPPAFFYFNFFSLRAFRKLKPSQESPSHRFRESVPQSHCSKREGSDVGGPLFNVRGPHCSGRSSKTNKIPSFGAKKRSCEGQRGAREPRLLLIYELNHFKDTFPLVKSPKMCRSSQSMLGCFYSRLHIKIDVIPWINR